MCAAATNRCQQYLLHLDHELIKLYNLARNARSKGIDPAFEPETHIANDLADMVEGLVGPEDVGKRIRELSNKMNKYEMAFVIAEDIVHAKYGHTDAEHAAEQAVKTALAIMTGGITAAPIQGIAYTRIKQNLDHSRYLTIYFAGPIRSAGGTEQALILIIGDHIRQRLGLNKYKATQEEIRRFIEEVRLYEREVARFQYHISDSDLENAIRNLPIEVSGIGTNPVEVSSFRNLPRIETNRVRGGALRVVNDGVVGRAQKVVKIIEDLRVEGWDWLTQIHKDDENNNQNSEYLFMEDVIAGRPIFSFPDRKGGFRLRYGRARNMGIAAMGIHPLTMTILHNFLASGTQIRIDKPGKGGITLPVDTIEPPIVKLKNGSVIRVDVPSDLINIKQDIEQILFLGDLLVGFGEFLENNKPLEPSGYTEEWWVQDFKIILHQKFNDSIIDAANLSNIPIHRIHSLLKYPLKIKPTAQEAVTLSKKIGIPLHPHFTYFWKDITFEDLSHLRRIFIKSYRVRKTSQLTEMNLRYRLKIKNILDNLCVSHTIKNNRIIIHQDAIVLASCLNLDKPKLRMKRESSIVQTITKLSGITVKDKALTFIGARMGRPEKAKARQMSPLVHVLFPTGMAGGPRRDIGKAAKEQYIQSEVVRRKCTSCSAISYKMICPNCGSHTIIERSCPRCKKVINLEVCPNCQITTKKYDRRIINIKDDYKAARNRLGFSPSLVKGVRSLMSESRFPEAIEKGMLRAKYDVSIFKDGTIRFDATNAPITHFKPIEINVPISQLIQLGYSHDMHGHPLEDSNQICEIKIHDVIIPMNCAEYLIRATQFIDELLEKVYDLQPYYNVKREEDLIGHLIIGLAPHTSAGVLGRIIGLSQTRVCYAHPLWHNVKRRDCDGDEDALLLVLDVLLNFSKSFLPERIGGVMDAPFLLITAIDPFEVDEAHNLDVASFYPLFFYEQTLKKANPKIISQIIDMVVHRLGTPAQFEGYSFTHETENINEGSLKSSYTTLGAMTDKLTAQLRLAEIIRAVDAKTVAKKVLTTHFMRDIAGNLRAFTKQKIRCKKCNMKYRRIPLSGKCPRCGGSLLLTVHKKGIEKYLEVAQQLVHKYSLEDYYKQRLDLITDEIRQLFMVENNGAKQVRLGDFI